MIDQLDLLTKDRDRVLDKISWMQRDMSMLQGYAAWLTMRIEEIKGVERVAD